MRRLTFSLLLALVCSAAGVVGARAAETALAALKLLPKEAPEKVASIQAFEGKPLPERWHILVFDSAEETGVREYVVAAGEVVASRTISQFAEELKAEDVMGMEPLKVDSDQAVKVAQRYAQANKVTIASYNYELKKDGEGAVPLWHLTCLDDKGASLGKLVITATKGKVIAHDGFPTEPKEESDKPEKPEKPEKPDKPKLTQRSEPTRAPAPPAREVRRAEPVEVRPAQPVDGDRGPGFFRRVFGGR